MEGAASSSCTIPGRSSSFFGTPNGTGEKAVLEDPDSLDEELKAHFVQICRPCSGCQTCTRGGKARVFTVPAVCGGRLHQLCPQFPRHEWESIDPDKIRALFKYRALQEQYGRAAGRKYGEVCALQGTRKDPSPRSG